MDCKQKNDDPPYRDLYVYQINGLVGEAEQTGLGDAFLGNWVEDKSSFLFFAAPSDREVTCLLRVRGDLELVDDYYFTYEQWQGGGLDDIRIENLIISPPWKQCPSRGIEEGTYRILLDPGVVFGNGLHPTTRDCLKALVRAGAQRPFSYVLDLGTGTGILALAAAFLGAKKVLASDLNPLCVKTARENVRRNLLDETIQVVETKAEDLADHPADLVVANIHYPVVRRFLETRRALKNDRLIVSGLMRSQRLEFIRLLDRLNYRICFEWDHEMTWFTLLAGNTNC